jgi:hypothetical protein
VETEKQKDCRLPVASLPRATDDAADLLRRAGARRLFVENNLYKNVCAAHKKSRTGFVPARREVARMTRLLIAPAYSVWMPKE